MSLRDLDDLHLRVLVVGIHEPDLVIKAHLHDERPLERVGRFGDQLVALDVLLLDERPPQISARQGVASANRGILLKRLVVEEFLITDVEEDVVILVLVLSAVYAGVLLHHHVEHFEVLGLYLLRDFDLGRLPVLARGDLQVVIVLLTRRKVELLSVGLDPVDVPRLQTVDQLLRVASARLVRKVNVVLLAAADSDLSEVLGHLHDDVGIVTSVFEGN